MNPAVLLCSVELRADTSRTSPGLLRGVLMRYGDQAKDRNERFTTGALQWPSAGIVLNREHDARDPIMIVHPRAEADQVTIEEPLPDTESGRHAAAMVRDGTAGGLSVEFRALRQTIQHGIRVIDSAFLSGAALVDAAAYRHATVEMRRRLDQPHRTAPWL